MKTVILLRGVSGSGKSTLAGILASKDRWVSVCADDYFTDSNGVYTFDASLLGNAHRDCKYKFMEALLDPNVEGIVVANTNTKEADFSFYETNAKFADATFISLVVENRHGNKDIHGVPESVLEIQERSLLASLKLR